MHVNIVNLTGSQLDWAVAKAEGHIDDLSSWMHGITPDDVATFGNYHPSTDWTIAGPIIERLAICADRLLDGTWMSACRSLSGKMQGGPTLLVSAMRCYVASILGEVIEVPEGSST